MWTPTGGKRREMGLGAYPAISLADARIRAAECRTQAVQGLDPIRERDREREKTFGECAEDVIVAKRGGWKSPKHASQWETTLAKHCASLTDRPVSSITKEEVLSCLEPIWETTHETADRVRSRMEAVFDYASAKGWRAGENPARWKGYLSSILQKRKKSAQEPMAAVHYDDVPALFAKLSASKAMSATALQFLILTAARSGEVREATWSEIDFDKKLWTIPKNRMKAGATHYVPLSDQAIEILDGLKESRVSEFVFPGQKPNRPMSDMTLTKLLRDWGVKTMVDGREKAATAHGFRSSFRDWCGNVADYPRELAEEALAHKIANKVEAAYRREPAIEKRRKMMQEWGGYCGQLA